MFIIEYLFKYIYKGNVRLQVDNVSMFVDNEMDSRIPSIVRQRIKDEMTNNFKHYEKNEINRFELMHCIPATQATWKFLGYRTSQNQPGVHIIDIELPGNEVVHFKPNNIASMEETIANKVSAQDIYWNRPAGEQFNKLTLENFFDNYVVAHVERRSTKHLKGEIFIPRSEVLQRNQDMQLFVYSRQKNTSSLTETINRMKFVSPACGDLYYLRMLFRHYPSRSWIDARTVNGNVYDTCRDACVAMSIISNKTEFDMIMKEAIANLFVSAKLRRLFVMVLLQKYAESKANFIKYAVYMSLDFYEARNMIAPVCQGNPMMASLYKFTYHDMPYDIQQDLLRTLQEMLLENNWDMESEGLPLPKARLEAELERERTKYDIDAVTQMLDSVVLNEEQSEIVKYIFSHTDNIFIDGPFGRGKSFLLDYILGHIRARKSMIALAVAPTGVMAIARGGFTMHGIVKMDIEPDDADRLQYHIGDNSQRAALIRGADYLIVEEGPNAHRRIWESLERACRDVRKNESPFGGLRVITAGDFRQIPPPIKSCDERDIYDASVKSWHIFRKFTVLHLTQPIRTANDKEWTKVCDDLGNGTVESVLPDIDGRWTSAGLSKWIDLPQTIHCYDAKTQLQEACDWIHPDVNNYDAVVMSALVAVTNKQVDEHNNYFLNKVIGESRIMESSDQILSEMPTDVKYIIADFTDAMPHSNMPPSKLLLKVNGIYTCMRSINFGRKLMNGTVVRIVSMTNKYITVYNYTTGLEDDIPRINFKQNINSKSPLKISRHQFPLRPRYAMTSNIVQGKTIQHMLLDLRHDPFAHGQLHVACSRVPQASQLRVLTYRERIINNRARTVNVVDETLLKPS